LHAQTATYESRSSVTVLMEPDSGNAPKSAQIALVEETGARSPPGGPAVSRGMGTGVPATDPGSVLGEISPAVSTGVFSGSEIGFEFESNRASTSPGGYAQLGTLRNGVFL
jgi:hypothetical protein